MKRIMPSMPKELFTGAAVLGITALLMGAVLVKAPSANAQTVTEPQLSGISVMPSNDSATVTWNTDEPANSQIEYGTTSSYTASTTLDTNQVMDHSEIISGLMPDTTYHYAVISTDGSGNMDASQDALFTTTAASSTTGTTTASTTEPDISFVVATPSDDGVTVTWNTDEPSNSQLMYGTTSSYGSSTTLDTTMVTSHSETISGLNPDMTYYYEVVDSDASGNTNMYGGQMFTTLQSSLPGTTSSSTTSTSTGTTGTTGTIAQVLESEITQLEAELATLLQQLSVSGLGSEGTTDTGSTGTTGSTGPTGTMTSAMIEQNGETVQPGGTLDFSGRNFGKEEQVMVMMNGQTVATAHADGGGNFSTGSFTAPTTPGTYSYTFTGQNSGMTAMATITVQ
jgi:hypothetical protein